MCHKGMYSILALFALTIIDHRDIIMREYRRLTIPSLI